jgi:hypothetical protein
MKMTMEDLRCMAECKQPVIEGDMFAEDARAVLNLVEAAQRVTLLQSREDLTDARFELAKALAPFLSVNQQGERSEPIPSG